VTALFEMEFLNSVIRDRVTATNGGSVIRRPVSQQKALWLV
jgi:hypothetical protein